MYIYELLICLCISTSYRSLIHKQPETYQSHNLTHKLQFLTTNKLFKHTTAFFFSFQLHPTQHKIGACSPSCSHSRLSLMQKPKILEFRGPALTQHLQSCHHLPACRTLSAVICVVIQPRDHWPTPFDLPSCLYGIPSYTLQALNGGHAEPASVRLWQFGFHLSSE